IVEQQRRQNKAEPSRPDRLASEMAEIGIERLSPSDDEENEAERHQPNMTMAIEKGHGIGRIDGSEHTRIVVDMENAGSRNGHQTNGHDWGEEAGDSRSSWALAGKKSEENDNRQRRDIVLESRRDQRQSLDRREHGDGGRDHRVAQEHGGADHAEQ